MWFFKKKEVKPLAIPSDFRAAGCLFFWERLVLGGYQPSKKKPQISGLGGMRQGQEIVMHTAFRETVEELYHVNEVPIKLLQKLIQAMDPKAVLSSGDYVSLVFDERQLIQFLRICKKSGLKSPLYLEMPTDICTLLFKRLPDPSAEITHLCALPLVDTLDNHSYVSKDFLNDIRGILNHPELRITS